MPNEPKAQPESVNARLADYLCTKKEQIIGEWLGRVRADPAISTDTLTTTQLKDHLPQIFDDLAETLRRYGSATVAAQSEKDAETHGKIRWQQGYEPSELLREIKHLRTALIYHRHVFQEMHPDYGLSSRIFACSSIHSFLDECAISATEEFLKAQKKGDGPISPGGEASSP